MKENAETRILFTHGPLGVVAEMSADDLTDPGERDFDTEEQRDEYLTRYDEAYFELLTAHVRVVLNGRVLGEAVSWGIEHGKVFEGVERDAWNLTPESLSTPVMGSPLWIVADVALTAATTWLSKLADVGDALVLAAQWAHPDTDADAQKLNEEKE